MAEQTKKETRRAETMRKKYGDDWAKIIAAKSRATRIANSGSEQKYIDQMRAQGAKGGKWNDPERRGFSKNPKLAAEAGRKGGLKSGK